MAGKHHRMRGDRLPAAGRSPRHDWSGHRRLVRTDPPHPTRFSQARFGRLGWPRTRLAVSRDPCSDTTPCSVQQDPGVGRHRRPSRRFEQTVWRGTVHDQPETDRRRPLVERRRSASAAHLEASGRRRSPIDQAPSELSDREAGKDPASGGVNEALGCCAVVLGKPTERIHRAQAHEEIARGLRPHRDRCVGSRRSSARRCASLSSTA